MVMNQTIDKRQQYSFFQSYDNFLLLELSVIEWRSRISGVTGNTIRSFTMNQQLFFHFEDFKPFVYFIELLIGSFLTSPFTVPQLFLIIKEWCFAQFLFFFEIAGLLVGRGTQLGNRFTSGFGYVDRHYIFYHSIISSICYDYTF